MSNRENTLSRAYDLINQDDLAGARELLQPLIGERSSDPNVWWLYAHAVEDEETGRRALERVIELDPSRDDAYELLDRIIQSDSSNRELQPPPTLPGFGDTFELEPVKPQRRRSWVVPVAILIVLGLLGILLLPSLLNRPVSSTPTDATSLPGTDVAQAVTLLPTLDETAFAELLNASPESVTATEPSPATQQSTISTDIAEPTDTLVASTATLAPSTANPATNAQAEVSIGVDNAVIVDSFVDISRPEDFISIARTSLGTTLIVAVCSIDTPEAAGLVQDSILKLAQLSDQFGDDIQSFGVRLFDCEQDRSLRTIAVPISTAQAYLSEEITLRDFQRLWQPVD